MRPEILLGWLLESSLAITAGLLLVLALRLPLRRLFGAGVAYATWALLPLSLLAVSLPAPIREVALAPLSTTPSIGYVASAAVTAIPETAPGWSAYGFAALVALWGLGALAAAWLFWRQQRRYLASLGRLRHDPAGWLRTDSATGCPAVMGAFQPRIVLPADFEARYPAHQGELVLAHERVHLARQDVRLNLLAVVLRCLHWFNPLLHFAARAYRQDQELACDATVLAKHPHSRRAYADAMLKTQLAVLGLPVGCHWQSSQSLKERILMLKQPLPRRGRIRLGAIAVAGLLMGTGYAAWALQPERVAQAPAELGRMLNGKVLYADVTVETGPRSLFVWDGGMGNGPGGATRAFSGKDGVLRLGIGEAEKELRFVANVAGTQLSPELQWHLEQQGRWVDTGRARWVAGNPIRLKIDGARYDNPTSVVLSIGRADKGMLMGGFDTPRQFARGADGVYIDEHGGSLTSGRYTTPGDALVLVQISKTGQVVGTKVESSTPAGIFTDEEARDFFADRKYLPLIENGVAVPARIRTKVTFSPLQPETGENVSVSGSRISVRDAAQRLAASSGLKLVNPEVLPIDRNVAFTLTAVPAATAFQLIGEEVGMSAVIADGMVHFEPAAPAQTSVSTR